MIASLASIDALATEWLELEIEHRRKGVSEQLNNQGRPFGSAQLNTLKATAKLMAGPSARQRTAGMESIDSYIGKETLPQKKASWSLLMKTCL